MSPSDRPARRGTASDRPDHVERVPLDHGVAVGDVTAETAVVWTRTDETAVVHLEYRPERPFTGPERAVPRPAERAVRDGTVAFRLTDLQPGTAYRYRVWALSGSGAAERHEPPGDATTGRFVTPPTPDDDAPVSFVWSSDTYGQGRAPPYQVLRRMAEHEPDFFLYLGDTIYADDPTPALPDGDPETVDDYRAKYREMREEGTHLRDLLRTTSVVVTWDDHEVANDWAGTTEPRLPAARQAFFEYWPVDRHPSVTGDDDARLYRSFRWGADLELFVLDARQYRDDNTTPDGPEKTMLGEAQREWLKTGLADTDATFAVVASSVSLTSPSSAPDARDGWADGDADTGFEHELADLVDFVRTEVDATVVWLAGDRHFARLASFDVDRDGRADMYEAIASPIGAAPREPGEPDPTFAPAVHYQEGGKYELGEFYSFGRLTVRDGTLEVGVYDKAGDRRCSITVDPDDGRRPTVDDARRDQADAARPSLLALLSRWVRAGLERVA